MLYLLVFLLSAVGVFCAGVFIGVLGLDQGRYSPVSEVKCGVVLGLATVVCLAALISVGVCLEKAFTPRDWIQGAFAFVAGSIMFGGLVGFLFASQIGEDNLRRLVKK